MQFIHNVSQEDISKLKRLPSVKRRSINIEKLFECNQVVGLKDGDKLLLLTFYHVFENFVYMHTTIGRDQYKGELFKYLFSITTQIGPSYCVLFESQASINWANRLGGIEVELDSDILIPDDFCQKVNDLTDTQFYVKNQMLLDHNDSFPLKNPLYLVTRESFLSTGSSEETQCESY